VPGILDRITTTDASIWILTETNDEAVSLTASHPYRVSTHPVAGLHTPGERWTTIWSKYPIEQIPSYDPEIAACGKIQVNGHTLLVYGTVLPWHADRGPFGTAKNWTEFHRVLPLQTADWRQLRHSFPKARLCVAGDLNQSLDERRWNGREYYGTRATRAALVDALSSVELSVATGHDLVASGHLTARSTIDHICIDQRSQVGQQHVGAWEPVGRDGTPLSDHNGVWVDMPS
jgi:hypothetical protein